MGNLDPEKHRLTFFVDQGLMNNHALNIYRVVFEIQTMSLKDIVAQGDPKICVQ